MRGDEILWVHTYKKNNNNDYDLWLVATVQRVYCCILYTYIYYVCAQTGNQNGSLPETAVAAQFN